MPKRRLRPPLVLDSDPRPRGHPARVKSAINHWQLALDIVRLSPESSDCLQGPLAEIVEELPEGKSAALEAMEAFSVALVETMIQNNLSPKAHKAQVRWTSGYVAQLASLLYSLTYIGGAAAAEVQARRWLQMLIAHSGVENERLAATLLATGVVIDENALLVLLNSSVGEVRTVAWLASGAAGPQAVP